MEEMELVSLLQSVLLRNIRQKKREWKFKKKIDNLNKNHDVVINANAGRARSRNT